VADQARFETKVNICLDRLQKTIVDSGENEGAVLHRLRIVEQTVSDHQRHLDKHEKTIGENTVFKDAWINRVIGMALLVPLTTTIAIASVAYVISLALDP
jgi:hypothetical protein